MVTENHVRSLHSLSMRSVFFLNYLCQMLRTHPIGRCQYFAVAHRPPDILHQQVCTDCRTGFPQEEFQERCKPLFTMHRVEGAMPQNQ